MQEIIDDDRVYFGPTEDVVPTFKAYLEDRQHQVPYSVIYQDGRAATKRLRTVFGGQDVFDNPKDEVIIRNLVEFAGDDDSVILDFFAGSGTTGHAVMQQNAEDGGNRRYILVQLPEPLAEPKTLEDGTRLTTIADICRERVRRAGRKISAAGEGGGQLDTGFRAYKLAPSNFRPWDGSIPSGDITRQLELAADHIDADATEQALLTELLLKIGFALTTPVAVEEIAGQTVYNVEDGTVLICLEREISLDLIEAMADRKPTEIICLDAGFPDDQVKVNAGQIIASQARHEEISIAFKVV